MPNSPIYGAILYDKDEICPHNKIATAIKKVYHHSDPIRLKDVCLMRKLGDKQHRPGSEYDSCNYLWSVTLQSGANPYAVTKAKNEPAANALLGLRNGVIDRMRRSFQQYRCHLNMSKQSKNMPMEWILRPRDLTNFSSQESIMKSCATDRIKKIRASCPAAPSGFKKPDPLEAWASRRPKLSLLSKFPGTMSKSNKNLVNKKRRKAVGRIKGGAEQLNPKVLRKTVVVKKQLAEPLTKEEYIQAQPIERDEFFEEGANQTEPAAKLETRAKKTEKGSTCTHQHSVVPPALLLNNICSTSKSEGTSLLSSEFGEGFGRNLQAQNRLGQAFHQHLDVYRNYTKEMQNHAHPPAVSAVKPLQLVLKPDRSSNAQRASRVIKRQTYRLYRILRSRGKCRRMRDKSSIKRLYISKTTSLGSRIMTSSPSVRSAKSALLCEPSKEIEPKSSGNHDKSKATKRFRRRYEAAKLVNVIANKPLQQPEKIKLKISEKSEGNEVGSEQSEFCISYHTPITLRALIQRRPRANRTKSVQQVKRKEASVRRSSERTDLLHEVTKYGKRGDDSRQAYYFRNAK